MKVYRLSRRRFSFELSGKGASKFGNRWNSKGVEIVYTADSRALAMAEVAVHLTIATLPKEYVMMVIEIPDALQIEEINISELQEAWNNFPGLKETQNIGDQFIENKISCVLKVPSAVVKGDFNYLINPYHTDFKKIKIEEVADFPFDRRMFK
ncbi:MAG TPA: RES family NAD+ phosphorylase [Chitinophagales bacterium]|nr:RES family NAD+ phosphorylase [Chitinophagales bacterium]